MVSLQEFIGTCYHTRTRIVMPLLNRKYLEKADYFVKGKYMPDKVNEALTAQYYANIKRFEKPAHSGHLTYLHF